MGEYKRFFIFLLILFVVGKIISARLQGAPIYKGPWYTVAVPEGWDKKKEEDEIIFLCPVEDVYADVPEAMFSIYAKKVPGTPLWLDDLFIEVIESLQGADGKILDKGEIKIDGEIGNWVLFRSDDPPLVILSFYLVDDNNRFTKIQYITQPDDFKKYRPEFEKFRASFKFKKLF